MKLEINEDENRYWYNKKGNLHREGDKPAIEFSSGDKWWYKNGEIHRDNDKPAIECSDGYKEYWINGNFIKRKLNEIRDR